MSYTKTNWVNNSSPKINATNLNKLEQGVYDNTEDIGDLTQLRTTDKSNLVNAINETKGVLKWTNSSITSPFPAQTITIPIQINSGLIGYSYYELIYCQSTTRNDRQFTTGKIKSDCGSVMAIGNGQFRAYDITINTISTTQANVNFIFENASNLNGDTMNASLIPVKIKMFKGED